MKLFVWDFHGVLEKGNDDAVLEISNLALDRHGYLRRMTYNESIFLSGRRWYEYFSYLLPEASIDECMTLQATCLEISHNHPEIITNHMQLNDHADLVLDQIQRSGYQQILISNSAQASLDLFVVMVGIEKYFPTSHRFGVNSHIQQKLTKQYCLKEFVKDQNHYRSIVSIGDSPTDMALIDEDLRGVGYLYTHPNRTHRSAKCHHKINDLRVILQELSN